MILIGLPNHFGRFVWGATLGSPLAPLALWVPSWEPL